MEKWGLAFVLACPSCTVGLFALIAAGLGVTAVALKGFVAAAAAGLVAALWARNAWRRRGECATC